MAVATLGALVGIGIAYSKYLKKKEIPVAETEVQGLHKVLSNKYYLDEIYMAIIVKPIYMISSFAKKYVEKFISKAVIGLGGATYALSIKGKKIQNGNIGVYLFAFIFGMVGFLVYVFIIRDLK